MIPHKLSLQNFLSYKSPQEPLDFSEMHLAVLIGQNGHGKSALLDAITWALWGKARAADDDLIHLGSAEMIVDFEFYLGEQLYRVERKRYRRGKSSKPRLDLFIWDEGEARWQPLTESGARATQRKIEEILRMDYETFVHTAFLKQGEADAFTSATPGKRKNILGKALNLARYDRYAIRAREMAKELQREVDRLEGRLSELRAELAQQQAYEEAIRQARVAELETRLTRESAARAMLEAQRTLQDLTNKEEARKKLAWRVTRAQAERAQTEEELARARERLAAIRALLAQKEEAAEGYRRLQQAEAEDARWNQVLTQRRPLEREERALEQAIERERALLETDLALKKRQLQEAEEAVENLPDLEARTAALQEDVAALEQMARAERANAGRLAQIAAEVKQARRELERLQKLLAALPELEAKRTSLQEELARMEALDAENQARRTRLSELRVLMQQARHELERIKQEADDLNERRALLERGETDSCPVCRRPLGETGREHVLQEYEQTLAALREQYREVQASLTEMAQEEKALKAAIDETAFELRRLPGLRNQLAALQARLEDYEGDEASLAEQAAALQQQVQALTQEEDGLRRESADLRERLAGLAERRRMLAELENRLAEARRLAALLPGIKTSVRDILTRLEGGVRPDLQKKLTAVREQLEALTYDEQAHEQARRLRRRLQDAEELWRRVQGAEERLPEIEAAVARLAARGEREAAALAEDEQELAALAEAAQGLPEAQAAWREAQQAADEAHRAWKEANDRLVAAEQRLQALEGVRRQRARLEESLTEVKGRLHRYQVLEKAFGRDGVQAMIIEAALPELEAEANRLLARLSDGRMNVRLETQQEKKTGGLKEALDVIISDELGSRPYELYSGGEAFRVDLALRIALSRLLARRAGAALQTLFIDEGFGTQDAQGRENLVEAIHMIKDEFALILVITHIDELKDQFPVRIMVEKGEEGSVYRVG